MKKCPKCGSKNLTFDNGGLIELYKCKDCDYIGVLVIEDDK